MKLSLLSEWVYTDTRDEPLGDEIRKLLVFKIWNAALTGKKIELDDLLRLRELIQKIVVDDDNRAEWQQAQKQEILDNIDHLTHSLNNVKMALYLIQNMHGHYTGLIKIR